MKRTALAFLICASASALGILFAADAPGRQKDAAPPDKVIANSIGMKLVPIPAGKFQMGSAAE